MFMKTIIQNHSRKFEVFLPVGAYTSVLIRNSFHRRIYTQSYTKGSLYDKISGNQTKKIDGEFRIIRGLLRGLGFGQLRTRA